MTVGVLPPGINDWLSQIFIVHVSREPEQFDSGSLEWETPMLGSYEY